jgi:integrase/recombinase XerC
VRPCYQPGPLAALWLTERGGRISVRHMNERFAAYRQSLGLPVELSPHCLRHSYISHLVEDGVDPLFVQQQVGHSHAATTAIYTSVTTDYRNRVLRAALDRAFSVEGSEGR